VLALARSEGYEIYALTFRYGQRHEAEIEAARRVAASFDVAGHTIAQIDLRAFGGSALTDDIEVPKNRALEEMGEGIPVTYVPARNTIFLSFALAWAEVLGASDIFIGVNALDYCVPASTDIMTEQGVKKIQDIKVGERVLSYGKDGMSWKRVVSHWLSKHQDNLLRISCGRNIFECTPNHHMLKVDYEKKFRLLMNKRIVHVQAQELKVGDYLLVPSQEADVDRNAEEEFDFTPYISGVRWAQEQLEIKDGKVGRVTGVRNYLPLKCQLSDVLTLLGWYVTEGWMTNCNGVCISQTDPQNIQSIVQSITSLGLRARLESSRNDNKTIFFSHPVISHWFKTLGTHAQQKRLPEWCLRLPNRYLAVLFETLIKGDGSWNHQAKQNGKPYNHFYCDFHSSSEVLLKQTIYVAMRLGYRSSMQRTKSGVYSARFSKPRSRMMNGASLMKITAIEVVKNEGDLYDITVEDNHTFVGGRHGFIIAGQSGYPDCRPEYIEAFQKMADLATKAGVEGEQRLKIHTPLIQLTKAQIISKGIELGVDYSLTVTCYGPSAKGAACGECDACRLRLKGFAENGLSDPAMYAAKAQGEG
jgi:7-cyano-7-deazaguanine synthase in queuosine biosynthesis/intein/homing endonuclease